MLFVDEDGNPIEAGEENVVYVDESGNELASELALQLLDSGKYVDSRDLYNDFETSTSASSTNGESVAAAVAAGSGGDFGDLSTSEANVNEPNDLDANETATIAESLVSQGIEPKLGLG